MKRPYNDGEARSRPRKAPRTDKDTTSPNLLEIKNTQQLLGITRFQQDDVEALTHG